MLINSTLEPEPIIQREKLLVFSLYGLIRLLFIFLFTSDQDEEAQ